MSGIHNEKNIIYGVLNILGSAQRLSNEPLNFRRNITVLANDDNTGDVLIGDISITSGTAFPLFPGKAITLEIDNSDTIFAMGTSGDILYYIGT